MKILALEKEVRHAGSAAFTPELLKLEAARVWELQQACVLREIYFRQSSAEAVLVLEVTDVAEARRALASLPLVAAGLIRFEIVPLTPYSGLARLFGEKP